MMQGRDFAIAAVLAVALHCGIALVRMPASGAPPLLSNQTIAISFLSHDSLPDVLEDTAHENEDTAAKRCPPKTAAKHDTVRKQEPVKERVAQQIMEKGEEKAEKKIAKEEKQRNPVEQAGAVQKDSMLPVETHKRSALSFEGPITKTSHHAPPLQETKTAQHMQSESVAPHYRSAPPPKYPAIARRRGYEGEVLLAVVVAPDGTVSKVTVKKPSGHSLLDRAAVEAVSRWRFEPARRMGVPVSLEVDIPVRFVLETP